MSKDINRDYKKPFSKKTKTKKTKPWIREKKPLSETVGRFSFSKQGGSLRSENVAG